MASSMACSSSTNDADDLNTCAVCYEKYNHNDRIPKYLVCLHTFCTKCLGVRICNFKYNIYLTVNISFI